MADADPRRPIRTIHSVATAHPINAKPYHCIRFSHFDHNAVPIYQITGVEGAYGAYNALRHALARHGGHCFHCDGWIPPQPMSHEITRDHILPSSSGGSDYLHNLVLAHGDCNRAKGAKELADFSVERGSKYLRLLDRHIIAIIETLSAQNH
jgi:5-methylcytosine-specific restriction endonuclease McrA